MKNAKKTLDSAHGFITAFWASFGVAILAAIAVDGEPVSFMQESWLMAVLFAGTIYTSSYFIGMRVFAWTKARKNSILTLLAAFVVSELVLGVSTFAGGIGYIILESIRDGQLVGDAFESAIAAPFAFMMFGVMFTGPLALGLGVTVWVRDWRVSRAREREFASKPDAMS